MHGLVFYDAAKKYLGPDRRKGSRRDEADAEDHGSSMEADRRTGRDRRNQSTG